MADEVATAAAAGDGSADAQVGGNGDGDGNNADGNSDDESEEFGHEPERIWRREVEETFLRCIKMRFDVVGWSTGAHCDRVLPLP